MILRCIPTEGGEIISDEYPKKFQCVICNLEFDWFGGDYTCPECRDKAMRGPHILTAWNDR